MPAPRSRRRGRFDHRKLFAMFAASVAGLIAGLLTLKLLGQPTPLE